MSWFSTVIFKSRCKNAICTAADILKLHGYEPVKIKRRRPYWNEALKISKDDVEFYKVDVKSPERRTTFFVDVADAEGVDASAPLVVMDEACKEISGNPAFYVLIKDLAPTSHWLIDYAYYAVAHDGRRYCAKLVTAP